MMRKTLVLMRHGKALPLEQCQADKDRPLSPAGRRALDAQLPNMLELFQPGKGPVALWSSPGVRARETAQLLEKALKARTVKLAGPIEEHDSLWEQDESGFLEELESSSASIVCAVGHNPFIESVAESLTGAQLPCATGALMGIAVEFAQEGPGDNRLLWFSQGPASQHWKTLVRIEETLASCADAVERRRAAFIENPADVETLHKLRVSIRTLRSLVAFVKPWQDPSQNARMQALLREIVGYTSKQRELDVFAGHAAQTSGSSEELVAFCLHEAALERDAVLSLMKSKGIEKKLAKVIRQAHDVRWRPQYASRGLPASCVRARFDAMIEALEAEMADLDISDAELTHDVRKRAKRARYSAENFEDILGPDAVPIAKGMTAHQDDLGAICDARVNIQMINEFLQRDLPDPIVWDLSLMRAEYETFLFSLMKSNHAATGAHAADDTSIPQAPSQADHQTVQES